MSEPAVVVLVHGGPREDQVDAARFWRRTGVVAALEERGCPVVAPDRARRAASRPEFGPYLDAFAGAVAGFAS